MNGVKDVDRPTSEDQNELLSSLANKLHRWHLAGVICIIAKLGQAVPVVASHVLLFTQPLLPFSSWRTTCGQYAYIFEHSDGWQALINELEALQS